MIYTSFFKFLFKISSSFSEQYFTWFSFIYLTKWISWTENRVCESLKIYESIKFASRIVLWCSQNENVFSDVCSQLFTKSREKSKKRRKIIGIPKRALIQSHEIKQIELGFMPQNWEKLRSKVTKKLLLFSRAIRLCVCVKHSHISKCHIKWMARSMCSNSTTQCSSNVASTEQKRKKPEWFSTLEMDHISLYSDFFEVVVIVSFSLKIIGRILNIIMVSFYLYTNNYCLCPKNILFSHLKFIEIFLSLKLANFSWL